MNGIRTELVPPKLLQVFAITGGALWAAWTLSQWILSGSAGALIYLGLGFVALYIAGTILRNWQTGFFLFLVWLLFEDLVRKYMGNNMMIYFGKDVLVGLVYLSFFAAVRRRQATFFRPPFLPFFYLFLWLGILQVFNPGSPALLYGGLGMKVYFYYVPLVFVGYALVEDVKILDKFLLANMALAAVIALVGIIQAVFGATFLNPRVLQEDIRLLSTLTRQAPISKEVFYRPNSVFVSDGRFAWYLILVWLIGVGAAGYLLLSRRKGRGIVFFAIMMVTAGILLTGSRGAIMYTVTSAIVLPLAFLWGAPWRQQRVLRLVRALRWAFVLGAMGIVVLVIFFPSAVSARWAMYTETLLPDSPAYELEYRAWDYPVNNFMHAFDDPQWVYGHGIGTASLGIQYVSRLLGERPLQFGVESGFGALIAELGILGPILWVAWAIPFLFMGWRVVLKLRGTSLFPVGFSFYWFGFLLAIPLTYGGMQAYENYIFNAYFWLMAGMLYRLPALAENQRQAQAAPSSTPNAR